MIQGSCSLNHSFGDVRKLRLCPQAPLAVAEMAGDWQSFCQTQKKCIFNGYAIVCHKPWKSPNHKINGLVQKHLICFCKAEIRTSNSQINQRISERKRFLPQAIRLMEGADQGERGRAAALMKVRDVYLLDGWWRFCVIKEYTKLCTFHNLELIWI